MTPPRYDMGYSELRSDPGDAHAPLADWCVCVGGTGWRWLEPCLCTPCVLRARASHEAQNGHADPHLVRKVGSTLARAVWLLTGHLGTHWRRAGALPSPGTPVG